MPLDKAIMHGKEHRKAYRGTKAVDHSCRNHGGCSYCEENRRHKFRDKHPVEKDASCKQVASKLQVCRKFVTIKHQDRKK